MYKVTVDGVEVRTSSLTQSAFRAAPCETVVCVTPKNLPQALVVYASERHSGLRVCGIADLSFLAEVADLRYLEVVEQPKFDPRPLDQLSNLRGLRVETPGAGLDFSCFPLLEVFVGDWHPANSNVGGCDELRRLHIWQYKPKSGDVRDFAGATRLEWLHLTQTGIQSLDGVENLEDLRYLEVAYAAKLQSLDALRFPAVAIRELGIEKAKQIASYEPIAAMRWLRRLQLFGCAPMPNLKWTKGLDRLDSFSFVETNVEDGDLSPLLELPLLRYAGTMDKKHYSHRQEALNQLLEERTKAAQH